MRALFMRGIYQGRIFGWGLGLVIFGQGVSAAVLDLALDFVQKAPAVKSETRLLERVPVIISDQLLDHEVARYEWGRVLINGERLDRELAESQGDEVAASAHLVSSIAHELRHALNQELLPRIANSIEEETSAFVSELAAYAEIQSSNPQAFKGKKTAMVKYSKDLWRVWRQEGPDGLRSWVKSRYFISSVEDEFYWDALRQERSYLMGALDQLPGSVLSYERAQRDCESSDSKEGCLRLKGFVDTLEDWIKLSSHGLITTREDALNEMFRQVVKERMLQWDSEANRLRIFEFYRQENCRAWSLWREHFPQEQTILNPPQYCPAIQ